ncbi:MAG: hypothetical protein K2X08_05275, partial [Chlamydiales bacterium]|nr:hypothetical protein [Chlamydiales bacterium]
MILISPKHITGNFNISSAKKNISSFISETNQITHTIFKETLPHLIAMSPWNVSKTTSMRGVILPFMLVSHAYLTNIKEFLGQRKRPANNYFKESLCLNPGCRTLIEANEA